MIRLMIVAAALGAALQPPLVSPYALTPEMLSRAIVDPRGGGILQASLIAAKIDRSDFRIRTDVQESPLLIRGLLTEPPFEVYLLTPYKRAAITAADARRRFVDVPPISAESLNADGILVSIVPSPNFLKAESIENVVLSVGAVGFPQTIVKPFRSELEKRTISNALGASKTVIAGAFHFHFSDFDRLPLSIVCVGPASTFTIFVSEGDLP
jgi:hypothetical protein